MTDEYGRIHTDGSRSGGQPLDDSIEAKAQALVDRLRYDCHLATQLGDDARIVLPAIDARTIISRIEAQAAEIERLREENLQLRSQMTMIELDSFDAYDDWCLRGLPEEAIGFADRTHQRAKAVLLGGEYDGD